jgi:hypothetical protein
MSDVSKARLEESRSNFEPKLEAQLSEGESNQSMMRRNVEKLNQHNMNNFIMRTKRLT